MRYRTATLVVTSLVLLAACGDAEAPSDTAPATPEDPLAGRTFIGDGIDVDGEATLVPGGGRLEFSFRGAGDGSGTMGAHAGCNHLSADYRIDGSELVSSGVGGTDMGCPPEHHAFDELVTELLSSPTFELDGERLILVAERPDGRLRAELVDVAVADPEPPLAGTVWTLESLLDGETVSSVPAGVGTVTMTMQDGELTVDTGCNGVWADYVLEGSAGVPAGMVSTVGASTRMSCGEDVDRVEALISAVLEGRTTIEQSRRSLTIVAEDGRGLGFTARD
jgi:heat shock protein HslJ